MSTLLRETPVVRETTVRPVKPRATCAWCRHDFATIVELLDHVDHGHLDPQPHLRVVA